MEKAKQYNDNPTDRELVVWEALKERCNAATRGPWHRVDGPQSYDYATINDADDILVTHINKQHNTRDLNIAFIMHAREDIPMLIDEVELLRALIPEPELLRRLADHADATCEDAHIACDLAQRIEDALTVE